MNRTTWRIARITMCVSATLLAVYSASAPAWATGPTPQQIKCEWKKHRKAGRYQACVQDAVVEEVKNPAFDLDGAKAACIATFEAAWLLQETLAADAGDECLDGAGHFDEVRTLLDAPADRLEVWLTGTRWVDNGDGTATDSTTGLQWELKTDDGTVHDKDNVYAWGSASDPFAANGAAFTDFLSRLNGSADGACFAGHCDWRLPTIEELSGTVDLGAPDCHMGSPCTAIPGPTLPSNYWASSTMAGTPQAALSVTFGDGSSTGNNKASPSFVRAVRGGS